MPVSADRRAAEADGGFDASPVVTIAAGTFITGSDRAERDAAYALDEAAYGHDRTRQAGWYDREAARHVDRTGSFSIMRVPVTNADYARFVAATGHPPPEVDRATWSSYGLIHPYASTRRFVWSDGTPPDGRADHPVVLVSHADAEAYARSLATVTGKAWRLPTALEWERAARGDDGRRFPWGDAFDPSRLNRHDLGPFDTLPVGLYPAGASPYGVLDAAGQVIEWTATDAGEGRFLVKGGSWDDKGCGLCRPAIAPWAPRRHQAHPDRVPASHDAMMLAPS